LIASLGISLLKLTAGSDLYPAAAEMRWQNFAAARCSGLWLHNGRVDPAKNSTSETGTISIYARVPVAKLNFLGDCNEKAPSCMGSCRVITLRLPAYVYVGNTVYEISVFIFS
jgi:hypothetical protein